MTQIASNDDHPAAIAAGYFGEQMPHRAHAQGGLPDPAVFERRYVETCVRSALSEEAAERCDPVGLVA